MDNDVLTRSTRSARSIGAPVSRRRSLFAFACFSFVFSFDELPIVCCCYLASAKCSMERFVFKIQIDVENSLLNRFLCRCWWSGRRQTRIACQLFFSSCFSLQKSLTFISRFVLDYVSAAGNLTKVDIFSHSNNYLRTQSARATRVVCKRCACSFGVSVSTSKEEISFNLTQFASCRNSPHQKRAALRTARLRQSA